MVTTINHSKIIMLKNVKKYRYLISYYIKSLLGNKQPLLGGIKLTHKCNLSCLHCPFWKRNKESLSYNKAIHSLNDLYNSGVRILIIEGGEPFIWKDENYDLTDIVDYAKNLFFSVGVTTNGTFPIDVNSDIVWVSIDGLKKTHDKIRGKCFDKIIKNIKNSPHPKIYGHITINSINWQEIPKLIAFLSQVVKGITIQFHYPYNKKDSLFLPFEKREQVLDNLISLKKEGYPVSDSYACLNALKRNQWKCRPWMIASIDPDGKMTQGCYLQGRGEISCSKCGFAAHTELSLAYNGVLEAIKTGNRIFF